MANKETTDLTGFTAGSLLGQNAGNTDLAWFAILNALTETVAGKVLDARQGKVLKDLIDTNTSNIGLNTSAISGKLTASSNLSDLLSAGTARSNLGLGTLATQSGTFTDKADLASPTFSGNPTAPTQTEGNNSLRLANTAFVKTAVDSAIAALIGTAPSALDTLGELSDALADNADFAGTITTLLAGKAALAGATFTGDVLVPDEVYNATNWNGSLEVPTKNAIRDKIESMGGASSPLTLTASNDTEKPLIVKAFSGSQSANLFEAQASGGTPTFQVTANGGVMAPQAIHVTGTTVPTGAAGSALELLANTVQSYNRSASAFQPLYLSGSTVNLQLAGTTKASLSSAGFAVDLGGVGLVATEDLDVYRSVANTNTVYGLLGLRADSTGTPAAGFGGGINFYLESTTTSQVNAGQIANVWTTATHASRASAFDFKGIYNGGALATDARITEGRISTMRAGQANPTTSELTSLAGASLYVKGSKFVIAYNNGGTITYITIPLDGSTATWTHSTSAP